MSLTKTKAEGVTVITLTADPQSSYPPICQLLKALCYSPPCCTVSQRLRSIQGTSQSLLGTLQILIGLLHIGLGAIYNYVKPWNVFPFWLGGMFIFFGIMCVVSEKRPIPCLVVLNVILNLTGVIFAIVAIVLYSLYIADLYFWWMCDTDYFDYESYHRTTPSPAEEKMKENCLEMKGMAEVMTQSILAVLLVLSVMELCIVISSVVLGIKSLRRSAKGENESPKNPEGYEKLMQEAPSTLPA